MNRIQIQLHIKIVMCKILIWQKLMWHTTKKLTKIQIASISYMDSSLPKKKKKPSSVNLIV